MAQSNYQFDSKLDLKFERIIDVPSDFVWKMWTSAEHLKRWFCPLPWKTIECEIDLQPGGIFRTVMLSPEGQKFPNFGCYLEIVKNKKLVWTNALLPNYRPAPNLESSVDFFFTATIMFEPHNNGTKYTSIVVHKNEKDRAKHEKMGFQEGWGKALDQMIALYRPM